MAIPPLITTTGLVLNNMMPGEGALGGYTPKGTASSEGISLMLRGILRAAIATNDPEKLTIAKSLFDSACDIFYHGKRPADVANGQLWNHSWIANGGTSFTVRGPLDAYGNLAEGGFIYNRDSESTVSFVNGEATLNPPPDIVYQVVTESSTLVWNNVFSDLSSGTRLQVDFYIDSAGNQVFGSQTGGSFAQPAIKAGEHTAGGPGFIKLKTNVTGTCGVNYCNSVPTISVQHAELYEAWPMWRKMGENEVSCAADAVHWFIDAYKLAKELEPANTEWQTAIDKMLAVWQAICSQESNSTVMFKEGSNGEYNNFPLTYSYAYGRTNVDDPTSKWNAQPPSTKCRASRTLDGYVTFDLPSENSSVGSGRAIRYGMVFENKPLFLEYTEESSVSVDMRSSVPNLVQIDLINSSGLNYSASVLCNSSLNVVDLPISSFLGFQTIPGDAVGDKTGDWSGDSGGGGGGDVDTYVPPVYSAVSFPGRRAGLIGDSITYANTFYNPPLGAPSPFDDDGQFGGGSTGGGQSTADGYYEYFGFGTCGYFTYANQILGQRLMLEPAIQDRSAEELGLGGPVGRYKNGNNFGIAGSRTDRWELAQDDTLGDGILEVGPMYNARRYINKFDVVVMMGGTNDLAGGSVTARAVFSNLRRFAYEMAAAGKWVFLLTIMPRTTEWLGGYYSPAGDGRFKPSLPKDPGAAYTIEKQELVRTRILEVNSLLRAEFGGTGPDKKANIWLVDTYNELAGPNGRDPFGLVSSSTDPTAKATYGNWKPGNTGIQCMYDGLHPGPGGAYFTGKKLAEVMVSAGVPPKGTGAAWPYSVGPNLLGNPNFVVTTTRPNTPSGKSNVMGRAIGLGPALTGPNNSVVTDEPSSVKAARCNVGLGYQYGQVPDYWQIYRSQNTFTNGADAEGWTNFNEYTWSGLLSRYPSLSEYMADSTWLDGQVLTSVVTHNGATALKIEVNIPQTGNKSEAVVIRSLVPKGQHGPWDNYGYAVFDYSAWFSDPANGGVGPTQDQVNTVINTLYQPGDFVYAESRVLMENVLNLYTWRMALNFLAMDSSAITNGDVTTTGAPITAYANSQNFWPPTKLKEIKLISSPQELTFRTPAVKAPQQRSYENQYVAQYNFEFAFDCSEGPATAVIYIKNPGVYKITGGLQ